ncbi:hypothetical protein [Streptomyces iconiensis]|uniref:Uncharacterized protein n=1 Tax=Streptomyces iconiensis TaxID=1384038 RepID=A0ABT6ZUB9_9ACTN|nr:hypothetical protein [Streptomyces iconiensis]MDJ1132664.1 hypothetical protein [Streptomyces iconiensis]
MNAELVVALLSGAVALVSVGISARASRRQAVLAAELERQTAALDREVARQDVMSRVRDPLLWAAYDLQSRIYNIARSRFGFLTLYYKNGSPQEREYARRNTLYVIAEYFCWVEIIRRRVQFLDLGNREDNWKVVNFLHEVSHRFSADRDRGPDFRLFRGEQRAIGELMIRQDGEEPGCLGYAEFCRRLEGDQEFGAWFASLDAAVQALGDEFRVQARLIEIQHTLIKLIKFLDEGRERFPFTRELPQQRAGASRWPDAPPADVSGSGNG